MTKGSEMECNELLDLHLYMCVSVGYVAEPKHHAADAKKLSCE